MYALLELLWDRRSKIKQPVFLLYDGKGVDPGKVNAVPMTGVVDQKIYAPLKKAQVKDFPALREVVDADSDDDF